MRVTFITIYEYLFAFQIHEKIQIIFKNPL